MTRKYLIVVDMQEDFVYGTLGTPEARNIVPVVVNMVKEFDGNVILTRNTGRKIPARKALYFLFGWMEFY